MTRRGWRGLERRKFVESLDDGSLKLMFDVVNGARTLLTPNSEIIRGLEALSSQVYLISNPPYSRRRKRHDVFTCHSSSDKLFVRRVADDLGAHGFKVWFDEFKMPPVTPYTSEFSTGSAHQPSSSSRVMGASAMASSASAYLL